MSPEHRLPDMAGGLSSNWKKLQDRIHQDASRPPKKRPRDDGARSRGPLASQPANKKPKTATSREGGSNIRETRVGRRPPDKMGNSHSSRDVNSDREKKAPMTAIDPQLVHAPSSEALADVFRLGLDRSAILSSGKERINEGLAPGVQPGKYIALDCEMVGIGEGGYESALARVSVVDYHGAQVYDSFVKVDCPVTDWRTAITGITSKTMALARPYADVRRQILDLVRDRIVVGHDLVHDIRVLGIEGIPTAQRRDTATFGGFKKYGNGPKPKLKDLSRQLLGIEIQRGYHSSIQDARIAMALFRKYKQAFDLEHASRDGLHTKESSGKVARRKAKAKKRR